MKLYHGSSVAIENPQILKSDRKLDFGTGFYLTSSYEQAEKWAVITMKRRKCETAVISVFDFDEDKSKELKILKFEKPDIKWLRYVTANRKGQNESSDYDIVIGPVANDRTMPVISLYFSGIYTEEETIKRLLPQKLKDQIVFKTEKSLKHIKYLEAITL